MVEKNVTRAVAAKRVDAGSRREEAVVAESLTPSIPVVKAITQQAAPATAEEDSGSPDKDDDPANTMPYQGEPKKRVRGYQGANFVDGYVDKRQSKAGGYPQTRGQVADYNHQSGSGNKKK
ncbi:hypothetical protein PtA15_4A839 [Puccinia triticina]|uniref:Hyaluronan/mRNA-binding protein domain-containing protein n=1 Tax=Puccinia triticina TaxID=208348 RepID=A0ABY7CJT0_9BASI|nr:uncharacterized protein PtA15_4A839 [Puccinia triticina]WAQ84386.1 hypothetical protein PtA15_4A839 [Puccinia triticina]